MSQQGGFFDEVDRPKRPHWCEKHQRHEPCTYCIKERPLRRASPHGAAERARDEAIERVVENAGDDFSAQVWAVIRATPAGTKFIGEELRLMCLDQGVQSPPHHNAWGGVMAWLPRSPLLKKTGAWRKMQTKKSHARATQEYMRVAPFRATENSGDYSAR